MSSFFILGTLLLLILAFFFLAHSRNSSNKFHLDYLLLHFIVIIASFLLGLTSSINTVLYPVTILGGLHVASMMLLLLHVESAVIGFRRSPGLAHWLPIIAYLTIALLNSQGYYLIETNSHKSVFIIYSIEAGPFFGDQLFVRLITSLMLVSYVVIRLKTKIDTSTTLVQKPLYRIWLYGYSSTIACSMIFLCLYYFGIFHPYYNSLILNVSKAMVIMLIVSFVLNPTILYYLPSIGKSVNIYNPARENLEFYTIEALMREKQLFLNPRLNLTLICSLTGLKPAAVSKAIKTNTSDHFSGYINKYRIEYALSEIASGYLKTYSVVSLGSKSGFASHQTFFRAFRKETGQSPSQYYKAFASKQ